MITIKVNRDKFKAPKYIYRRMVTTEIKIVDFEGKSLEPECKTVDLVDFKVEESEKHLNVTILANNYTLAKRDLTVMRVNFNQPLNVQEREYITKNAITQMET